MNLPVGQGSAGLFRVVSALCVFMIVTFIGCDITTPEPPLQTDVTSPVAVQGDLGNFHYDDHVAGIIKLAVPKELLTFQVGDVRVFVDDKDFYPVLTLDSTYWFSLDTRNFTQKEHKITIAVYEKNPTQGMYNLLRAPRLVCNTWATFDQSVPSKVDSLSASYDGSIRVRWAPSTSPTFRQYEVTAVFSSTYLANTDTYTTTISARSTTTWSVSASGYPIGTTVDIYCAAGNGVQASPSAHSTTVVGRPIGVSSPIVKFWQHPSRSETYAWGADNKMYVLGADGATIVRKSPVLRAGSVFFNVEGSKFYLFSPASFRLSAYSTEDFSPVAPDIQLDRALTNFSTALVSSNGRIYVGDVNGMLWTYSEATGTLLDASQIPVPYSDYMAPKMTASRDGKYLYFTDIATGICKINITSAVPVVERRKDLDPVGHVYRMELTEDQQHLIVSHFDGSSIAILNAGDLSTVVSLPLTIPANSPQYYGLASYSTEFVQDGSALFVVSAHRFIEQFDLTTNRSVGSWCIINAPATIGVSGDKRSVLMGALGIPIPNLLLPR